ncbi:hypothetical protein LRP50_25260 [Enterovibrio sp. ZSDZ42]|uniref:Uncharacterized protein n=1 Tax=Enterovibrio gelatinilyticus TaxID=2899819 RepID=A0ABT5R828_9GAMM|nr:hypothetical protein [Enterovibrio sp. ZSDZ42]MDD1796429.1 hypothetical protein [Enterovibrio sp. ZSDZ42]
MVFSTKKRFGFGSPLTIESVANKPSMARKDQSSQGLLAQAKSEVRLFKRIGWQLYNKGFQGGRKTFPQILLYQFMAITVAFLRKTNVLRPLKRRYALFGKGLS